MDSRGFSGHRFMGKVAIVTGAASGIGRATASRFASEGASVVGNDRDGRGLADAIASLSGDEHLAIPGDIADEETATRMTEAALERFGRIDVLVNNAGIFFAKDVTDVTTRDIERVFGINFIGMIWTCKHVIPGMLENGKGVIINLGSVSAFTGQEQEGKSQFLYNSSKAAVVQFSISLATRYARQGIRVTSVCPGVVRTNIMAAVYPDESDRATVIEAGAEAMTALGRPTDPDEIAATIAFLASDDATAIVGSPVIADGGFLVR